VSSVHSPGFRRKGAAADHVLDRLEGPGWLELERRPEGVAGGEAEQGAPVAAAEVGFLVHAVRLADSGAERQDALAADMPRVTAR
jgi:hypothetical protein